MKLFLQIVVIVFLSVTNIALAQNSVSQFKTYLTEKNYEQAGAIALQALAESPKDAELAASVGDVFFELEDYIQALSAYTKAKEIDSKNNTYLAKWARASAAVGKPQDAITELQKAITKDKKNANLMVTLARVYLAANDTKNAELQITNALSADPQNPEVHAVRGSIYYNQSIWELARSSYEDALKYDTNNTEARQKLAEVYWQLALQASNAGEVPLLNEYLSRALAECNTLVQNNPLDANSWRIKGNIHFNAKQNMEAAQSYNKFIELRPNNFRERWRLAELFATGNNCQNAILHLEAVTKTTNPDITDSVKHLATLHLANCYAQTEDFAAAIATFTAADKAKPLSAKDLRALVITYMRAGDTTSALATFDRFIVDTLANYALEAAAADHHCDIILSVARIYNAQKRYADVLRTANAALQTCPVDANTPYCYYLIATAHFELKAIDSAIAALLKAIEINPQYYYAHILLGDMHFAAGRPAEAERQFNLVIDSAATDTAKYKNELHTAFAKLAGAKLEAKRYVDLIAVAKRWTELLPVGNENGLLYRAVGHQGNGDKDAACRFYNEVLKLNPDNKTAKDNKKILGC